MRNSLIAALLLALSLPVMADTADNIRTKLLEARADLPIAEVKESVVPGLWEVTLIEGTVLFTDSEASHFIAGDLYRVEPTGFVNVSDEKRNGLRKELIDNLDPDTMLVFSPEGEVKTSITVFTDIDCGYCRKLHAEVPEMNDLGIEVRYLAWPRSGLDGASFRKIVSAWCADNPQLALTKAKLGQPITPKTCDNPVAEHFQLGRDMGINGTPAIVYETGEIQPGYLPAAQMAARLGIN